ncbi:MAG: HAMP domain-containing sensor histidine kinase, partial [Frankia sp.]
AEPAAPVAAPIRPVPPPGMPDFLTPATRPAEPTLADPTRPAGRGRLDRLARGPRRVGQRSRQRIRALSLHNRMMLLVGVAVAATVAIVAAIALTATRVVLYNSVDDQLLSQAHTFGRFGRPTFGTPTGAPNQLQYLEADGTPWLPGPSIDDAPTVVQQRQLPTDAAELAVAAGTKTQAIRSVTVGGQHLRVATVVTKVKASNARGDTFVFTALQYTRPIGDLDRTLRDLALLLVAVGGAGIVVAIGLGRLVARSALKPLDELTGAAEHVARSQDLSSLIPVEGTDEIAQLSGSLNSMLRALEASREGQRQLIDDASHELRTPLTSLRTNIELLLRAEAHPDRALPAADRAALLADVGAQMRELTGLVSELVDLARDNGKPEDVVRIDLAEVARSAADRVRLRAKDVTITVHATPSPVDGRPNMLERAVTNLLDNAVKFSPSGGEVHVGVADGQVVVADEGPGIDPADREHIFDRFYRATSARGLPGSGLGLAIVADAAARHGGTVDVGASPAGGALLRLRIPPADQVTPGGWNDVRNGAGSRA